MSCEKIKGQFPEYLTGEADPESQNEVRAHISSCESCRQELENLSAVWAKLGVLPLEQPSGTLRNRFYTMLENAKKEIERREPSPRFLAFREKLRGAAPLRRPAYAFAASALLLVVGLFSGYFLNSSLTGKRRVAALEEEVNSLRQTAAVSMLDQPSASRRLKAVALSSQAKEPDQSLLAALYKTLDSDPSASVRLAAVDALYLFRIVAGVREKLIESLAVQDSPLVQAALIDLLVEIREQRAVEAIRKLIGDEKLNPDVKKRAEAGLEQLI